MASTRMCWKRWALLLGVKLEYVKMTFGSMLADLAADKFDIAMSGMGRTLDRVLVATFSKPYMRYGKLLLIRSADQGASRRSRTSTAPVSRSATTGAA